MENKPSENFIERKQLILLDRENMELKHKFKMKELAMERKNNMLFHEKELERIRIKSAEIRRQQERKGNLNFMQSYSK